MVSRLGNATHSCSLISTYPHLVGLEVQIPTQGKRMPADVPKSSQTSL